MVSAINREGLLSLLDTGATVVLPTQGAARSLRDGFSRAQQAKGFVAWTPPAVMTWREWTQSLWAEFTANGEDDRVLLNGLQEEALWAAIITEGAADGMEPGVLQSLTSLARSGFALAAAHEALDRLRQAADSFDAKAFVTWQVSFRAKCRNEGLLAPALLEGALAQHARAQRSSSFSGAGDRRRIHLAGFGPFTPAQNRLLDAVGAAGCQLAVHSLRGGLAHGKQRLSVQRPSPREELGWALQWIREQFQENPEAAGTFALVVPDPERERARLEPLLRAILAPELEDVHADLSSAPWHFAGDAPLSTVPLIRDALLLLQWTQEDLSGEQIGNLLLSPFFNDGDSFENRARFEMQVLRREVRLRPELSLDGFLALVRQRQTAAGEPQLATAGWAGVRNLIGTGRQRLGNGTHGDWGEFVRKLLRAAGWPGERTLNPIEYRAAEAWDGLLDLLATLDLYGGRPDLKQFLHLLQREAAKAPAPVLSSGAPVQILRLAETEGSFFDATVVLHATDGNLPAPERAHPLLGWSLQHALRMPGTDPSRTYEETRRQLEGILDRSHRVVLCSATEDETGHLRPSPFVEAFGFTALADESGGVERAPSVRLQVRDDNEPLPPLPTFAVAGGARVLEAQAACGFRAFATFRLGAELPETHALGLPARSAGNILHKAMELFWREVKTQEALREMGERGREAVTARCVEQAFQPLRRALNPGNTWDATYLGVLEERLRRLIVLWLGRELERSAFTVCPPEEKQVVQVGPLQLNIRPDRIDQVEDGFVFVDYKTSQDLSPKQWLGERPDAPQLPLYALLAEPSEIRGVAFARLRPGKDLAWLSLEDRPDLFPAARNKSLHDLEHQLSLWRRELDQLAWKFADGNAEVDPKTYTKTCAYCQQRLLCRLDATTWLAAGTEAEASEEEEGMGHG